MKGRLCAIVVCMFGVAVIAQSVDGKWAGEVQGGRGPQPVTLTLKADAGSSPVRWLAVGAGRTRFRKALFPVPR